MGTLEDEIKQSAFQSERQKGFLNILYTANLLRDKTAMFFKEQGILQQHYNVMRIVRGKKGEPTSPGQIIEVMLDKGRDLTRLVDKLVKIGYLERRNSAKNRRKVEIFLTSKGSEVTDVIDKKLTHFYTTLGVSEDEAVQMNALLDKLRD